MTPLWKKKPALGIGIGVGLVGALALAFRLRRKEERAYIPDSITPAIFATRACDTSHGRIVYHTSGSGEPLVFLHGIHPGASSYEWSKVYARFASQADVLAPDLIGFGESERPPTPLDADEHVESLAEFLRRTATMQKATLIASGISCQTALLLAARHPDLVSKLFLFLPSAFRATAQRRLFELPSRSLPGLNSMRYRNINAHPRFIATWLARMFADQENITPEHIDVLASCARQYGAGHAITGFHRHRATFDIKSRLADVHVPVLVAWPENAPDFPVTEAHALCNALPRASLQTLPTPSLLAPLETPDLLAKSLEHWLGGGPAALSAV
jgi:pimeloyl-ACP methyl ester carboxylesterase